MSYIEDGVVIDFEDEEVIQDSYGQVLNGEETYEAIARRVQAGPVALAWTDQACTLLAVQFSLPTLIGPVSRGVRPGHLWVSIIGYGSYTFVVRDEDLHPDYVAEKLGRGQYNSTWAAMADLVSGVLKALADINRSHHQGI